MWNADDDGATAVVNGSWSNCIETCRVSERKKNALIVGHQRPVPLDPRQAPAHRSKCNASCPPLERTAFGMEGALKKTSFYEECLAYPSENGIIVQAVAFLPSQILHELIRTGNINHPYHLTFRWSSIWKAASLFDHVT